MQTLEHRDASPPTRPGRRRLSVAATMALGLVAGVAYTAMPRSAEAKQLSCEQLADLKLPNTKITSASVVPAGPFSAVGIGDPLVSIATTSPLPTCSNPNAASQVPAFCRVTAAISEPGAADPINIDVWLPLDHWNGRFEGVGNHGFAGEIEYADMAPELVKGFAVAATDTGHPGPGTAWMQNRQSIVDYGSLGIHEMSVKAKSIIKAFYGDHPKFSYFNGCSTGGKEGLMAAQRFPKDFDGINIGGSANFAQIHNRLEYIWNGQVTFGNAQTPIGAAPAALVNAAAIQACDALDGVVDGVIDDPLTCPFKPSSLICTPGQNPATCLTAAQAEAVQKVYDGPRNPVTNEEIYPGLGRGTELGWGSNTSTTVFATATQFFEFMVLNNPNWDFRTFNFDSTPGVGGDTTDTDRVFSPLIDAIDPDLRAFQHHGGKILASHAWNSVVHPAARSIEYYEQVVQLMNGGKENLDVRDFEETQDFFRLFMAPGGSGSKGPTSYDSMPELQRWVEDGVPPSSILASHITAGTVDRTRPLCPYPQTAVYKGQGSIDDAANFECRNPKHVVNYFVLNGPEMDDPTTPPANPPQHGHEGNGGK
jgi:feruloyl esterase